MQGNGDVVGAVRWTRASGRYEETVGFYRDLVGLTVIGEFASSFGEDGTIFGLPDTLLHLEIVRAQAGQAAIGGFDQLVLYLDDDDALTTATAPLRQAGVLPDPHPHPYWAANGAVSYRDPDGRDVVFAPWVFGREPDPVDRAGGADGAGHPDPPGAQQDALSVRWYDADRRALRALFEEAEDSEAQLNAYIGEGRVLAAELGGELVGHLQLVETTHPDEIELKSMAVAESLRGTGIGRRLVERALAESRTGGYARMVVATAAADIDNLRFYQRRGFRFASVEQDAFGVDTGYPEPVMIDGIPLRDRVWFTQEL